MAITERHVGASAAPSLRVAGNQTSSGGLPPRLCCLLAVALLAIIGCSGDTTAPTTRDEIVIFGHLYVGEQVDEDNAVLITRTRPVDDYYDPEEAVVRGALVTLEREGSLTPDTLRMVRDGYYANPDISIDPLTTYHLRVEIDGENPITATTTTPHPFTMTSEPRELPGVMRHEDIPDSFALKLTCEDPQQIFLLDVYCLEDWEDARYINPFGDHDRPDDYDEYGRDNGEPRHIYAFFRIEDVDREGDLYRISFYSALMVFYGRYQVQLMSIDENHYNYLWREHPEESGGIRGGIGVFGSACRERYDVEVVE